jgi:RsiW-degrading membrane proteinase PrsW (M82 family)
MGYWLGVAKLEPGRRGATWRGLAWAIALHGVYDALIMSGTLAALLVLPLLLVGGAGLRRLFARAAAADAADAARGGAEASLSYQDALPPIL